jgi:hypothetical protein
MSVALGLMMDLAVVAMGGGECAVESGRGVATAHVVPEGVAPFDLYLNGLPFTALPGPRAGAARFQVRGVIRFSATGSDLRFAVAKPIEVADGMVHLVAGQEVYEGRAAGAALDGQVALEENVHLEGAKVPCAALTLDEVEPPEGAAKEHKGDGTSWLPRRKRVMFHERPGAGAEVALVMADFSSGVSFDRSAARPGWMRLRYANWRGASIEGWVAERDVRPMDGLSMTGSGSSHCCGMGLRGGVSSDTYVGPVQVVAGSVVLAEPGRGRWAEVPAEVELQVRHERGEKWVKIEEIPGIGGPCDRSMEHAWVALESVKFPPEAGDRGKR